jgi:hypothetical protein
MAKLIHRIRINNAYTNNITLHINNLSKHNFKTGAQQKPNLKLLSADEELRYMNNKYEKLAVT